MVRDDLGIHMGAALEDMEVWRFYFKVRAYCSSRMERRILSMASPSSVVKLHKKPFNYLKFQVGLSALRILMPNSSDWRNHDHLSQFRSHLLFLIYWNEIKFLLLLIAFSVNVWINALIMFSFLVIDADVGVVPTSRRSSIYKSHDESVFTSFSIESSTSISCLY